MRGSVGWSLWVALWVLASGCTNAAVVRFQHEYGCKEKITLKRLGSGAYRVIGCGRDVTYVCVNDGWSHTCVVDQVNEGYAHRFEYDVRKAPTTAASTGPQAPRFDQVQDGVKSGKGKTGERVINAQFGNQNTSMHFLSAPKSENRKVWVGMRVWNTTPKHKDCALQLMVNGTPLTLDPPTYKHEKGYEELRVKVSYEDLYSLAEGPRVVGRLCDDEFRLNDEHVLILRELVSRIYEELAWANMLTPEDKARHDKDQGESASEETSGPREL